MIEILKRIDYQSIRFSSWLKVPHYYSGYRLEVSGPVCSARFERCVHPPPSPVKEKQVRAEMRVILLSLVYDTF